MSAKAWESESQEALAQRLRAAVEQRRWLQSLEGGMEGWAVARKANEADEEVVDMLARMTIAVHRRLLDQRFRQPGDGPRNPGRGTELPSAAFGTDSYRDSYMDTTDPFVQVCCGEGG